MTSPMVLLTHSRRWALLVMDSVCTYRVQNLFNHLSSILALFWCPSQVSAIVFYGYLDTSLIRYLL